MPLQGLATSYRLAPRIHQIAAANIVVVAITTSELKHKMHQTPSTRASM